MARLARLVVPGLPHHITQRGNRRQQVFLAMVPDWNAFLNSAMPEEEPGELRRHVRTGRPLGDERFVGRLEEMRGRALKPQKHGPKPRDRAN